MSKQKLQKELTKRLVNEIKALKEDKREREWLAYEQARGNYKGRTLESLRFH